LTLKLHQSKGNTNKSSFSYRKVGDAILQLFVPVPLYLGELPKLANAVH